MMTQILLYFVQYFKDLCIADANDKRFNWMSCEVYKTLKMS